MLLVKKLLFKNKFLELCLIWKVVVFGSTLFRMKLLFKLVKKNWRMLRTNQKISSVSILLTT